MKDAATLAASIARIILRIVEIAALCVIANSLATYRAADSTDWHAYIDDRLNIIVELPDGQTLVDSLDYDSIEHLYFTCDKWLDMWWREAQEGEYDVD